jgi:hypothetical protein
MVEILAAGPGARPGRGGEEKNKGEIICLVRQVSLQMGFGK